MARAFDQAEVDRLAGKLSALGSDPDEENREMREVARKQLDALHDVDTRLKAARIERARSLKLLGDLWHQLVEVQQASPDPGALAETSEKLCALLARIDESTGEQKTVATADSGATEAMADAPTIER